MDSNTQPLGGKWSFDDQNRKKLPKNISLPVDPLIRFDTDLFTESVNNVETHFSDNLGNLEGFNFACSHEQAAESFENFLDKNNFGPLITVTGTNWPDL